MIFQAVYNNEIIQVTVDENHSYKDDESMKQELLAILNAIWNAEDYWKPVGENYE